MLEAQEVRKLVRLFKALSDETRHKIFELLCAEEELNVTDICEVFKVTQPTISHHLQILRNCDLVETRKEGKMVYYCINKEVINNVFGDVITRFRVVVRR